VPELHRRASRWLAEQGEREEAIRHAIAGADHDRAADLIELAIPDLRRSRRERTMREWFDALPREVFDDRPVLAMGYVGALMASGEFTGVELLLDAIDDALHPDGAEATVYVDEAAFAELPAQVAIQRAGMGLINSDPSAAIGHATTALALTRPDDHLQRGSASALVGLAEWALGNLATAEAHYLEAIPNLRAAGFLTDSLGCCLALADIQVALGRPTEARRSLLEGLEVAERHDVLRGTADLHVGLAELALARGDDAAAAEHLQHGADLGEHAALAQYAYRSRVVAARLCLAHDQPRAFELLADADDLFDSDFSPPIRPVPATTARAHLQVGDTDAAQQWAHRRGITAEEELSYVTEYEHLTLAQVLVATGDLDAAEPLVERLLAAAEMGGRVAAQSEALGLRGRIRERRGQSDRAVVATSPIGSGPVDDLSGRELDVLRLLRSDLSGPDIARELHVSLNTFRTHTKNIYAKLGATTRREALTRANELGL
jgi:LuxR family maltose regulon positive regulatory protein